MSDVYLNKNKKIKLKQDMQHDGRRVIHAGFVLRVLRQLYSDERGGLPLAGLADLDPCVWKRGNGQVKSSQLQNTLDVTHGYQHASGKMLFLSALETSIYTFNAKEWL